MSVSDELRQAADRLDKSVQDDGGHLAAALRLTADVLDIHPGKAGALSHAVGIARKVNAEAAAASDPQTRVSDDRVQEILDGLNGFVVKEYDGGTHIVNGAAVPCAQVAGCDANLDKAIAWAEDQPDVEATSGPLIGEANLRLVDGTFIEWLSDENQWAVTVSDDTVVVAS